MAIAHYIRTQQDAVMAQKEVIKQNKLPFALRDEEEEERDLW